MVVILFVVLGVVITNVTGRALAKRNLTHSPADAKSISQTNPKITYNASSIEDGFVATDNLENCAQSFGGSATHFNTTLDRKGHEGLKKSRSMPVSYGAIKSSSPCSERVFTGNKQALEDAHDVDADKCLQCCEWGFKVRLGLLAVSTFFATGLLIIFTMTTSDVVGKAIYGGDPEALPGSDSLEKCVSFVS